MRHRHRRSCFLCALCAFAVNFASAADPSALQPSALQPFPPRPAFAVTDRTWPQNPGDAEICLWPGDALAAVSFTIDDNNAPDHPWWLARAAEYDFHATWFVITSRVGTGKNWGTWDDFATLAAAGHEIASHTVRHFHTDSPDTPPDVEWEYAESQKQLRARLGPSAAATLAYPGMPHGKLNNPALAAKYYHAARAAAGRVAPANRIDYFNVAATNTANMRDVSDPAADIHKLLAPAARFYRGWLVLYSHDVRKPEHKQKIQNLLEYIKQRRADLHLAPFGELARFARARDTARLAVLENTPRKIVLRLTAGAAAGEAVSPKPPPSHAPLPLAPLTVKIRLPDAWGATLRAARSARPIPARLVTHDGALYALVEAAPVAAPVELTP
jgi:peptidoglycan/xylan/chitin deacetylase (PgdA/CDA1 family)